MASATATRFCLSRGLLGLQYDQINESESESESLLVNNVFTAFHATSPAWFDVSLNRKDRRQESEMDLRSYQSLSIA